MKIETKYEIGDTVWVYLGGQPIRGRVQRITIYVKPNGIYDSYNVMFDCDDVCLPGYLLFSSKEELLESL